MLNVSFLFLTLSTERDMCAQFFQTVCIQSSCFYAERLKEKFTWIFFNISTSFTIVPSSILFYDNDLTKFSNWRKNEMFRL